MRVDGKFKVGGEIPEGQAALTGLMEDCFDMVYQLRYQAEEASKEDDETKIEPAAPQGIAAS